MSTKQKSPNPIINKNGEAVIASGSNCIWNTALGTNSTLTIANSSRGNVLEFTISGVPESGAVPVKAYIGDMTNNPVLQPSPNGIFALKPNNPAIVYTAFGDVLGAQVIISNITNAQNDAEAAVQVVTQQ